MTTRMLIDASHPEETRVVVVKGNRLEEFDYESASKKQLRGNIYLAKVTRVEPSLQAAFVDYGGNRHGFLTFNEIHPDYYQIPIADREALLAEDAERQAADRAEEDAAAEAAASGGDGEAQGAGEKVPEGEDAGNGASNQEADGNGGDVEALGDDDLDEARQRRVRMGRRYKIQEVIKRRQVILVQVVKEERGTKGAALTTYLSFAGRYGVLMPNTARGGGISRKIVNPMDRRRLKTIIYQLAVPEGIGLIVRTAGANRSKAEIKRDYEYLFRAWDETRELTLKSTAPCLVHEEANLIKRSIRDLYTKDIEEVLVEGDEGYKTAKAFMRSLMPSHAKRVQPYRDGLPLFHLHQVEQQLDSMHSAEVGLKGGGYLVINPTEALVAIDVNSGRATRERNIEQTATKTNLEAAEEVVRQLRLRDLSGLIVIDFIDMDERRNNRAVERRLKDALKRDRARIQVGRISPFGLLEMSRQRLRPSFLEANTQICVRCNGSGAVRSTESAALHVLRMLEDEGLRATGGEITVYVPPEVTLYLLNQKRAMVTEIEARYDFRIAVFADQSLRPSDQRLERTGALPADDKARKRQPPAAAERAEVEVEADAAERDEEEAVSEAAEGDAEATPAKRRRRGKRGGRRRSKRGRTPEQSGEAAAQDGVIAEAATDSAPDTEPEATAPQAPDAPEQSGEEPGEVAKPKRRRRNPRKTKPRTRISARGAVAEDAAETEGGVPESVPASPPVEREGGEESEVEAPLAVAPAVEPTIEEELVAQQAAPTEGSDTIEDTAGPEPVPEIAPAAEPPLGPPDDQAAAAAADEVSSGGAEAADETDNRPRRRGWWKRTAE